MKIKQQKIKPTIIVIFLFLFSMNTHSQIDVTNFDENGQVSTQDTMQRKIEFYLTRVLEKEIIIGKNTNLNDVFIENFYFEIVGRPSNDTYIVKMGEDMGQLSFFKERNKINVALCPLFNQNCTHFYATFNVGIIVQSDVFFKMNETLDFETKYGSTIIKPTWTNLKKLLVLDMSTFKTIMKKYKYSISTNGSAYIADTQVGSPYFTIQKSNSDIMMVFTKDDGFASSFRNEIKKMIGGGTMKYESEYEVYYTSFESEGYKYNVKIAIKENMDGSSSMGIIKI